MVVILNWPSILAYKLLLKHKILLKNEYFIFFKRKALKSYLFTKELCTGFYYVLIDYGER